MYLKLRQHLNIFYQVELRHWNSNPRPTGALALEASTLITRPKHRHVTDNFLMLQIII